MTPTLIGVFLVALFAPNMIAGTVNRTGFKAGNAFYVAIGVVLIVYGLKYSGAHP